MSATFTNPTISDVRRDLVPHPELPHILYSHLISSLDNLMTAYIQAETCSYILYIATNCTIVVFMTVYVYIDIHTLQFCIIDLTQRRWHTLRLMWEYIVEACRPQMTIWRMRIECSIPKATNTHSEYVILTAFHCSFRGRNSPQCYVGVHCLYC